MVAAGMWLRIGGALAALVALCVVGSGLALAATPQQDVTAANAFASHLTENYGAFAEEFPALYRLRIYAQLATLARAIEPFMPFSRGVSSSRAPRKRSILRRSIDIESGMVKITL